MWLGKGNESGGMKGQAMAVVGGGYKRCGIIMCGQFYGNGFLLLRECVMFKIGGLEKWGMAQVWPGQTNKKKEMVYGRSIEKKKE